MPRSGAGMPPCLCEPVYAFTQNRPADADTQINPFLNHVHDVVDTGLRITLKERIVDYIEGRSYTYAVYEWKNFPIRKMTFGFTILNGSPSETTLAIDIAYIAQYPFTKTRPSTFMQMQAQCCHF